MELNNVLQGLILQQIGFLNSAVVNYHEATKFNCSVDELTARAEHIKELAIGLKSLSDSIDVLNKVGITNIDVESVQVFLQKVIKQEL